MIELDSKFATSPESGVAIKGNAGFYIDPFSALWAPYIELVGLLHEKHTNKQTLLSDRSRHLGKL